MKFISWNIDSLNAGLTGQSPRAELTRAVLSGIASENADFIAIQETKLPEAGMNKKQLAALKDLFPEYDFAWTSSHGTARKGYAGTMILFRSGLDVRTDYPEIGAPDPMDLEGRLITLELPDFFLNTVYTPNAGDGLRRLRDRQVWTQMWRTLSSTPERQSPGFCSPASKAPWWTVINSRRMLLRKARQSSSSRMRSNCRLAQRLQS